jgi:hypothetical protein
MKIGELEDETERAPETTACAPRVNDLDGRIGIGRSICARIAAANVDLNCLFEAEIKTGKPPPDWIVSALSQQAAQLGVEIQCAVPKRVAEELPGSAKAKRQIAPLSHLTPRTEDALVPAVRRTAKAAKAIRLFVMGKTRSNKNKAKQTETLNNWLGALRRLVKMDGVPPDGVLLYRLFEGEQVVCLPSDDDTFADCLSAIGRYPPWALPRDLAVALGPKREEFLVSLLFVEELANKCIANSRGMELRQKRGRPKKASCVLAQLRCAVIIRVLREVWPSLALSENEMRERLWQAVGGKPHTRDSDSGRFDVWRKDWSRLARQDTEIRRDVEYSFLRLGGADCRERLDPHGSVELALSVSATLHKGDSGLCLPPKT